MLDALWLVHAEHQHWPRIALLMGINHGTLEAVVTGRKKVMAGLAIRVARLAGLSTDAILAGDFRWSARVSTACLSAERPLD